MAINDFELYCVFNLPNNLLINNDLQFGLDASQSISETHTLAQAVNVWKCCCGLTVN